ncbi:MAG: hypothetical protein HPY62_00620 [Bacteroidales bacterium]|nr:hypothetical protein [Bacteroidales bacterium]
MIAEVKKYVFLVYRDDYENLLERLREAGVVHIVRKRSLDESSHAAREMRFLKQYRSTLRKLSEISQGEKSSENPQDPKEVLSEYESLTGEAEELNHRLVLLKYEEEKARPWGEFDPNSIEKLGGSGWQISLFVCPEKKFNRKWSENYAVEVIAREKGRIYFAVVHKDIEIPEIKAEPQDLPPRTANAVRAEINECENRLKEINDKIKTKAPYWISSIEKGIDDLMSRFEYTETAEQADRYAEDNLYLLEGWTPVADEEKVHKIISESDCYGFATEPEPGEKIPVILRNNKFATLFEPISKLFALPDYRELDLTPFFAPFFMLFFGFCLGDAGYGLIFIIAGFLVKRKLDKKYRPVITLAQYFGIATVVMGIVSGTFFGINLIDSGYTLTEQSVMQMKKEKVPENLVAVLDPIKNVHFKTRQSFSEEVEKLAGPQLFKQYKKSILKNAEPDASILRSVRHYMLDSLNLFYLAIMIGALQIIFGMILRIVNISKMQGFKYSLSTIGWVLLIITLVVFKGGSAAKLFDAASLQPLYYGLLIISGILIFFFNNPGKNLFSQAGKGIWDAYGIITGIFGDLLSYIRLFALGISSSILGFVFNQISVQFLKVPYIGWLLFIVLLLIGHTLNIAISTLGSFVHPMRLTFVEFYKNAGFTGGGIEYKPFKLKNKNT